MARALLLVWTMMLILVFNSASGHSCPASCSCRTDVMLRWGTYCFGGRMTRIPIEDISNQTQVLVITASSEKESNTLTIGPIFAQPLPYSHLQEINILHSNVPSIGQYSFWGLNNLKILNLAHNKITSIMDHNFRGLSNLVALHLDHNEIEQMPSETFHYLSSLASLSLAYNNIEYLMPRIFRMLSNLTDLDLSGNNIKALHPEVFTDIAQLKKLKCRNCGLNDVNTHIYEILKYVEYLDLGDNNIGFFRFYDLDTMKNVKVFLIDGNRLDVIEDYTFRWQRALSTLNVARNQIKSVSLNAFGNLTKLKKMDISHNKLTYLLQKTFDPLSTSLNKLDISGNILNIEVINDVVHSLPLLYEVNFSNLSIESLPPLIFEANPRLISLNLSNNHLSVFPKTALKRVSLQTLDLSSNKITDLDEDALQKMESIGLIIIDDNPWNCISCELKNMLDYMRTSVLNFTLINLTCDIPYFMKNVSFGSISIENLPHCFEGYGDIYKNNVDWILVWWLIIFISSMSMILLSRALYLKSRSAEYYTNEEANKTEMFEGLINGTHNCTELTNFHQEQTV